MKMRPTCANPSKIFFFFLILATNLPFFVISLAKFTFFFIYSTFFLHYNCEVGENFKPKNKGKKTSIEYMLRMITYLDCVWLDTEG